MKSSFPSTVFCVFGCTFHLDVMRAYILRFCFKDTLAFEAPKMQLST